MISRCVIAFGLVIAFMLAPLLIPVFAQSEKSSQHGRMTVRQFEAGLRWQTGNITLPGGIATLSLPASLRFLGPEDANRVLVEAWGNPPGSGTLGMIFPAKVAPTAPDSWGVIITYAADGHVSDGDAASIDYDALLRELQAAAQAGNEARVQNGYPRVQLTGWAQRPSYDASAKKMYWAKEIAFEDQPDGVLNYDVRVLGREGVLVMQAVSSITQLDQVRRDMEQVLAITEFTPGHRYADFDPSIDKSAAYGLAGLVAGGVAAKLGLLSKIAAFMIAGKKFIVPAMIALFALGVRLWRRSARRNARSSPDDAASSL